MTASHCERLGSDCTRKVGYGGLCKLLQTVKVINILKDKAKTANTLQANARKRTGRHLRVPFFVLVAVGSGSSIS